MKIRLNHLLVIKTVLLLAATLFWGATAQAATEIRDDQYIIFYHNDALGSPLVVTDHNGNTLWHEHSDPYGKTRDRVMPTGKEFFHDRAGSRKGYTGHLKDTVSDLVYMKARYYDPVVGRFYSNDPVGFKASNPMMFNRYAYANNNPYRYIDPDGREGTARSDQLAELGLDDPSAPTANVSGMFGNGMADVGDAADDYAAATFSVTGFISSVLGGAVVGRIPWVGKYFGNNDAPNSAAFSKVATTTERQLQKKFKHAGDFGVEGNYNKANGQKFNEAIQKHLNASDTKEIQGTYRGNPVTFHTDSSSGLTVLQNPNGSFLSGWKLSPQQLNHVLNDGKL